MVGEVQLKCNKVSRLIQVPIHGLFTDSHNSSCHGAIGVAIGVISVSGLSSSVHVWPSDMDIQFVPGTTHVLLTIQGTLLKTVLKTFRKTPSVMFGLHTSRSYVGLPLSFPLLPHPRSPVRYGSGVNLLYDTNRVSVSSRYDLVVQVCTISISEPLLLQYLASGELRSPSA